MLAVSEASAALDSGAKALKELLSTDLMEVNTSCRIIAMVMVKLWLSKGVLRGAQND